MSISCERNLASIWQIAVDAISLWLQIKVNCHNDLFAHSIAVCCDNGKFTTSIYVIRKLCLKSKVFAHFKFVRRFICLFVLFCLLLRLCQFKLLFFFSNELQLSVEYFARKFCLTLFIEATHVSTAFFVSVLVANLMHWAKVFACDYLKNVILFFSLFELSVVIT